MAPQDILVIQSQYKKDELTGQLLNEPLLEKTPKQIVLFPIKDEEVSLCNLSIYNFDTHHILICLISHTCTNNGTLDLEYVQKSRSLLLDCGGD